MYYLKTVFLTNHLKLIISSVNST